MHIAGIDLNLAVVLHALLEERNVSRAAKRVGLSQSAASHALARLRDLLEDPLFVRSAAGLLPTARAEGMAPRLASALAQLEESLLAPPAFDPASAQHTFQVGTPDYAEHVIMPALLARFSRAAPNMNLWTRPAPSDPAAALAHGQLDLIVGPTTTPGVNDSLLSAPLWKDEFVVVVRRDHPLTRGRLSVERFAAARHALIVPGSRRRGVVDDELEARGFSRRIAFSTPNFLVAPEMVAKSDLVITLAARVARSFAALYPLTLLEPPFAVPGFAIAMFWHARRDSDPAHRFLRAEVLDAARELPEPRASGRPRNLPKGPSRDKLMPSHGRAEDRELPELRRRRPVRRRK
jgi:DNA-binding transcriptional LysR family regulator